MAKKIILEDLENGTLSLTEEEKSTEQAWNSYRHQEEFHLVPFAQFKRQLKAHRAQVQIRKDTTEKEEEAMKEFRKKNPRRTHNSRGEPVFDLAPGKDLLREDMKNGKLEELGRFQLYHSPEEYKILSQNKFFERVKQEARRAKFINHLGQERQKSKQAKTGDNDSCE